jgi:hypothetical protein
VLLLNECLFLFICLSTQSGDFWIHPRTVCAIINKLACPSGRAVYGAHMVLDRSNTGIVGLNPAGGMYVLCCAVPWRGRALGVGRSPIQGALTKCHKGFTVSEVHSESEHARGPNRRNIHQQ